MAPPRSPCWPPARRASARRPGRRSPKCAGRVRAACARSSPVAAGGSRHRRAPRPPSRSRRPGPPTDAPRRQVSPRPVAPDELLNRELSWLEFNARVLHEAFDERNPLLERLKFLAIFATNLDEFYMVRVAGLRRQLAAGVSAPAADGLTPQAQLAAIEERVRELLAQQRRCLHDLLLPALAREDIRLVRMEELAPE